MWNNWWVSGYSLLKRCSYCCVTSSEGEAPGGSRQTHTCCIALEPGTPFPGTAPCLLQSAYFMAVELQLRLVPSKLSVTWLHLRKEGITPTSVWMARVCYWIQLHSLCPVQKHLSGLYLTQPHSNIRVQQSFWVCWWRKASIFRDWSLLTAPVSCPWLKTMSLSFSTDKIPGIWVAALRGVWLLHCPCLWSDVKSTCEGLESFRNLSYSMITWMLDHCKQRGNLWWKGWARLHSRDLNRTVLNWLFHWRAYHIPLCPRGRGSDTEDL